MPGQTWANFRHTDVDDRGNSFVAAETSNGTELLMVNGEVSVKEGDTVDGVYLAPPFNVPASVLTTSSGRVAFVWKRTTSSSYADHLFYTPSPGTLRQARRIFTAPAAVDFDGSGTNDATIATLGASGYPTVTAISGDWIYCRVSLLMPDGTTPGAIVRFRIPG